MMKLNLRTAGKLLLQTSKEWLADNPWRHSAIIAYYAIFSIPGLLMIVIWTAGAMLGQEAAQGELSAQISDLIGPNAAKWIEDVLANRTINKADTPMKIIGIGTLIFGATTLFFQLQRSLNAIWDVEADPKGKKIKKLILDRVGSLGLVLVIAFLLQITLVLSAIISILSQWIESNFSSELLYLVQFINFLISLGIVTCLFALMYKVLPDVDISWRSVWVGALVTALLFTIGKTLLGIYFGYADPGSSFGAAGTIILVMLWVNYSALILFFGAKFTQVYARHFGHKIKPSKHAKWRPRILLKQYEQSAHETKSDQSDP